MDGVNQNFSLA